jgi:tRNA 2-selenouridine synthase
MEWRELAPEDLYGLRNPLIIDVRSPCEFCDGRLPGAVNVPLLSNDERAEVGTIYKEQGDIMARRRALVIIAARIPEIIDQILALKDRSQSIVVHCWRGGLRSEAVASVLSIAGIASYRLSGGYKAWRNMVLRELVQDRFAFQAVVLYGLTGSGKTGLLYELARQGCQVLDLEDLANHRGSAFGGLGLAEQPGQKDFEAALWNRLRTLDLTRPVFLEAESRKVGKLSLPDPIFKRISGGTAVLVESSLEARACRLAEHYLSACASRELALQESLELLDRIKETIGKHRVQEIGTLARDGKIQEAVLILLSDYYDPLYGKSIKTRKFELTVTGDDAGQAALKLTGWLGSLSPDSSEKL